MTCRGKLGIPGITPDDPALDWPCAAEVETCTTQNSAKRIRKAARIIRRFLCRMFTHPNNQKPANAIGDGKNHENTRQIGQLARIQRIYRKIRLHNARKV